MRRPDTATRTNGGFAVALVVFVVGGGSWLIGHIVGVGVRVGGRAGAVGVVVALTAAGFGFALAYTALEHAVRRRFGRR